MAHPFDPDELLRNILGALTDAVHGDIRNHVQFAERQAKALAKQAAWITEAAIKGEIDADDRAWFLDDLAKLSENFARTVAALTILTIEKAWNAIVGVIWNAINGALQTALGTVLPIPAVPRP